jgi:hypothetical protein
MPIVDLVRANKNFKRCRSTTKHSETLKCLFCGGVKCKHCSPSAYLALSDRPAIEKLHSSWISDYIIAMQRPYEALFTTDYSIVHQFRRNRVTAIFNLTEVGEHPYCGCGILECSGFSYDPNQFMLAGINYFNYSWRDMSVPTMNLMMNLVHVAVNEIWRGGRVAIHCHAGYGRTGTAAACILIALDELTAQEAIELVRQRRPGSIQTPYQVKFVQDFEVHYKKCISFFPYSRDEVRMPTLKSFKESLNHQFYTLSFTELANPNLVKVSKLIYSISKCFREVMIDSKDKLKPSHTLCSAITALKYQETSTSDNSHGYSYHTACLDIPTSFFARVLSEINANNWSIYYSLIGIVHGEICDAEIMGLVASSSTKINYDDELDVSKIQYLAAFMLSQLMLLFLDTRMDPLIEETCVETLKSVWQAKDSGKLALMEINHLMKLNNADLSATLTGEEFHGEESVHSKAHSSKKSSRNPDDSADNTSADGSQSTLGSSPARKISIFSKPAKIHVENMKSSSSKPEKIAEVEDADGIIQPMSTTGSPVVAKPAATKRSSMDGLLIHVISNTSPVKVANIKAIVKLIQALHWNQPNSSSSPVVLPIDAAIIRIAISSIKASARCSSFLHLRY